MTWYENVFIWFCILWDHVKHHIRSLRDNVSIKSTYYLCREPGSVPSSNIVGHNYPQLHLQEIWCLLPTALATRHEHASYTYKFRENTHIKQININMLLQSIMYCWYYSRVSYHKRSSVRFKAESMHVPEHNNGHLPLTIFHRILHPHSCS